MADCSEVGELLELELGGEGGVGGVYQPVPEGVLVLGAG